MAGEGTDPSNNQRKQPLMRRTIHCSLFYPRAYKGSYSRFDITAFQISSHSSISTPVSTMSHHSSQNPNRPSKALTRPVGKDFESMSVRSFVSSHASSPTPTYSMSHHDSRAPKRPSKTHGRPEGIPLGSISGRSFVSSQPSHSTMSHHNSRAPTRPSKAHVRSEAMNLESMSGRSFVGDEEADVGVESALEERGRDRGERKRAAKKAEARKNARAMDIWKWVMGLVLLIGIIGLIAAFAKTPKRNGS